MGVIAILLGVTSFVATGLGVLLTPVPVVGAIFAFGAPVLALSGVILGGRAMGEARRQGRGEGTPLAGVIVSALAFIPALLTAVTCGVCNAMCSNELRDQGGFRIRQGFPFDRDGGVALPPLPPFPSRAPDTVAPVDAGVMAPPSAPARGSQPAQPAQPDPPPP
ncbi:MAG: hypothetical protein OEZ06_27040, partial [Myxococcales bacterium]|nr:hypothetical protein [Myxococcales bacterium]